MKNIDKKTVEDFGEEWNKYNQSSIPDEELKKSWNHYFDMFSFEELSNDSEGFDMGCGSGRWAKAVIRLHSSIKQAGNRSDSILKLSIENPVIIPILGKAEDCKSFNLL